MSATLGVDLRVTCHKSRGDRKYMEDFFVLHYEASEEHKREYAFFGIFDGHGGKEAALFAKEHLMKFIVSDKRFWSEEDEDVLQSITNGFLQTHYAMWQDQVNWPKTSSGLPSTSGTTASIAFIRGRKIYIGHVGDSSIVLGYQSEGNYGWSGKALTKDHKPEDANEVARIEGCGGKVVAKSGVPRVVWNRPRLGHKGPVRRSTPIDEIPFLAVARSLGDLWSYNSDKDEFVVSPHPDVHVVEIDLDSHRCLIFGTDGLWNMITPQQGVQTVQRVERYNKENVYSSGQPDTDSNPMWKNPSKVLVDYALEKWAEFGARADNTSAVTLLLDIPGVQQRASDRVHAVQSTALSQAVQESLQLKEGKGMHPSSPAVPVSDPRAAIFTRPTPMESAPVPDLSPSTSFEDTEASSGKLENENSDETEDLVTCDPSMESHENRLNIEPQNSKLESQISENQPTEPNKVSQSCGSTGAQQPGGKCCKNEQSLKEKTAKESVDYSSCRMDNNSDVKLPSPLKDAQYKTVISKDVTLFRKEDNSCRVSSNKLKELSRLQEPVQQLADSMLRHSHKRLRGKTVTCGDSCNPNTFSLGRSCARAGDMGIVQRRHSSVLDSRTVSLTAGSVSQHLGNMTLYGSSYQLGVKRRTRSEDKLLQAVGRLEDDLRTSDEENKRTGWTVSWVNRLRPSDGGSEENNAHSCSSRRKKWIRCSGNAIGRVKQARPSVPIRPNSNFVNGCDIALNRDYSREHKTSRVLRSDTHSGVPAHTLRSQNVDLKASRLSLHGPAKFTPKRSVQLKAALEMTSFSAGSSGLLPAAKLLLSSPALVKRHRQSFCGRTRSVTTRSRVKRLSK